MRMETEIAALKARNERVDNDKAWETSVTRRICIAGVTYIMAFLFFWLTNTPHPWLAAIVPTGGFTLSTMSLQVIKARWIKRRMKQEA